MDIKGRRMRERGNEEKNIYERGGKWAVKEDKDVNGNRVEQDR